MGFQRLALWGYSKFNTLLPTLGLTNPLKHTSPFSHGVECSVEGLLSVVKGYRKATPPSSQTRLTPHSACYCFALIFSRAFFASAYPCVTYFAHPLTANIANVSKRGISFIPLLCSPRPTYGKQGHGTYFLPSFSNANKLHSPRPRGLGFRK